MKMEQTASSYEQLTDNFLSWAQTEKNLRAAIVIGSRARTERPADQWSDLDLIIVTTDPQRFLSRTDWLEKIGTPWITFLEGTSTGGEMERRVLFEGGLDVDFAVIPARSARALKWFLRLQKNFPFLLGLFPRQVNHMSQNAAGLLDIVRRGFRVLIDKDGLTKYFTQLPALALPPQPPTQTEFLEAVNDFWYHTVWTAKHLRRGELWWAKSGCDERLKYLLRRMMEWHAHAMKGREYDTWMRGRFIEKWADPRAVQDLKNIYAHYDENDIWRALLATMDLFRWLSTETADRLGCPYPRTGVEHATELVRALYSQ